MEQTVGRPARPDRGIVLVLPYRQGRLLSTPIVAA
jgi:hypothetical protein